MEYVDDIINFDWEAKGDEKLIEATCKGLTARNYKCITNWNCVQKREAVLPLGEVEYEGILISIPLGIPNNKWYLSIPSVPLNTGNIVFNLEDPSTFGTAQSFLQDTSLPLVKRHSFAKKFFNGMLKPYSVIGAAFTAPHTAHVIPVLRVITSSAGMANILRMHWALACQLPFVARKRCALSRYVVGEEDVAVPSDEERWRKVVHELLKDKFHVKFDTEEEAFVELWSLWKRMFPAYDDVPSAWFWQTQYAKDVCIPDEKCTLLNHMGTATDAKITQKDMFISFSRRVQFTRIQPFIAV